MLRMEIALILVLGFVAYIYHSAERTQTALVVFLFLSVYDKKEKGLFNITVLRVLPKRCQQLFHPRVTVS